MKDRGFSFIEILVVLVLLSFSAALITPSFSRFLKTVELRGRSQGLGYPSILPEQAHRGTSTG
jgi:prepilin-type N-terminal cleavage/methylation domain-containing protein